MNDAARSPGQASAGAGDAPRRVERACFETDCHRVVGDVTLPPTGYQSRFSDALNRAEFEFIPLTNVEITSHGDGSTVSREFLALNKRHVRLCFPVDE